MNDPIRAMIDRMNELLFLIEVEFENDYTVVNPAGEEQGVEQTFRSQIKPIKEAIATVEKLLDCPAELPRMGSAETFAFLADAHPSRPSIGEEGEGV